MKFILAKKIEMSQVFSDQGRVHPVTWLLAGPVFITQKKSKEKRRLGMAAFVTKSQV